MAMAIAVTISELGRWAIIGTGAVFVGGAMRVGWAYRTSPAVWLLIFGSSLVIGGTVAAQIVRLHQHAPVPWWVWVIWVGISVKVVALALLAYRHPTKGRSHAG